MPVDSEQNKTLMAKKARHKDTRFNGFSQALPSDWGPEKILNPMTTFAFTDESAWNLIADLLETDHKTFVVDLEIPHGKQALEILYDFDKSQPFIYIKIHMGRKDKVIGRSFHLSTQGRKTRE